jgi:excisionase family DNA binding protein
LSIYLKQLKEMKRVVDHRIARAITTQTAADHCQVSIPTLKRWIQSGSLLTFRTPGGHHRILVSDFQRFLRAEGLPPYVPGPGPERILVADDDPGTVQVLLETLAMDPRGFSLESATDGYEALVKVGAFKPTVLILDVLMPALNGIEVCRRLRAGAETSEMKILGITGQPGLIPALMQAGADGCLAKPWRLEELRAELDRLLHAGAEPDHRSASQ